MKKGHGVIHGGSGKRASVAWGSDFSAELPLDVRELAGCAEETACEKSPVESLMDANEVAPFLTALLKKCLENGEMKVSAP